MPHGSHGKEKVFSRLFADNIKEEFLINIKGIVVEIWYKHTDSPPDDLRNIAVSPPTRVLSIVSDQNHNVFPW